MDEQFLITMVKQMISLWAFGLSGIAILYIGYVVFDKLTPGIHFTKEVTEKQNIAVAIVIGSILIGVSLIIAYTMTGG